MTALLEQPPSPSPSDWRTHLTDELKADPVVADWSAKASEKDIPSLIKSVAHANKRMGTAINLPGKDAKPEEVAALRSKLYEAGVFQAPPASPKDYGLVKPESLPEHLQWSDELAGKFATALHKHGVPKAALADLMPLYLEAIGSNVQSLKVDREKALAQLKSDHGEKYEERVEIVKRMIGGIFKTEEELNFAEQTGLADHPLFLAPLLRLAPLAMQDSSFMESIKPSGEETAQTVQQQVHDIMTNKDNPRYEGYWKGDAKVLAHIHELYQAAYPSTSQHGTSFQSVRP